MSSDALQKNLKLLTDGIDICLSQELILPALILLYSTIDTTGWLASKEEFGSGKTFIGWVDRYLLTAKPLKCTAVDLWGARCGLLHTFTSGSKSSKEGKARQLAYAWGIATAEDLQQSLNNSGSGAECIAVHVQELYDAWRQGLLAFAKELEADPARMALVEDKADKFFENIGLEPIRALLAAVDAKSPASKKN
jgi:hypothetical protein